MAAKRNYKKEYAKFQASTKQKQDRAKRNKARRAALKSGKVKKGDKKDVHHSNGINSSRTTVLSRSKNRGKAEKSRLKGSTRKKRA
tara:strand:+ start:269 stop:526 length:258 start_codon:yes stop_codon:yes gene_type:complete